MNVFLVIVNNLSIGRYSLQPLDRRIKAAVAKFFTPFS